MSPMSPEDEDTRDRRDLFAGLAMAGDWAAQSGDSGFWNEEAKKEYLLPRARLYYRMADAMLEAREERQP